jgi:hypothetical protein
MIQGADSASWMVLLFGVQLSARLSRKCFQQGDCDAVPCIASQQNSCSKIGLAVSWCDGFRSLMTQVLLVLIKKQPPDGRKLLVIGTSSAGEPAAPEAPPSPCMMPGCNDQRAAVIPSCRRTPLQLVAAAW